MENFKINLNKYTLSENNQCVIKQQAHINVIELLND